ncbi:hypothetical protein SLA2020_450900 [Shorea laevis]
MRNIIVILLLLPIMCFNIVAAGLGNHGHKNITITNILNDGYNLTIHCKSKQFDLGTHTLKSQEGYWFLIKPNFSGTSLFFCNVRWPGQSYWFDVYKYGRDKKYGPNYSWTVGSVGTCVDNDSNYCKFWE